MDAHQEVSNPETGDFFSGQGRTRVFTETYILVLRRCKPAENAAQGKNSRLGMETRLPIESLLDWGCRVLKLRFQ
jgi:hypothetical protein